MNTKLKLKRWNNFVYNLCCKKLVSKWTNISWKKTKAGILNWHQIENLYSCLRSWIGILRRISECKFIYSIVNKPKTFEHAMCFQKVLEVQVIILFYDQTEILDVKRKIWYNDIGHDQMVLLLSFRTHEYETSLYDKKDRNSRRGSGNKRIDYANYANFDSSEASSSSMKIEKFVALLFVCYVFLK